MCVLAQKSWLHLSNSMALPKASNSIMGLEQIAEWTVTASILAKSFRWRIANE